MGVLPMRISRLAAVALALSVAFALVAGFQSYEAAVASANDFAAFAFKTCARASNAATTGELSTCNRERASNVSTWMEGAFKNAAFAALAPVPLIWIWLYSLVVAARAQLVGWPAVIRWGERSKWQRSFVVVCVLAASATAYFAVLSILNLYADRKAPVALSPFFDVAPVGEDFVSVKGTWTREGRTPGEAMANPLQTSSIECDRESKTCVEARASVSNTLLVAELERYDIQQWTRDSIVMARELPCAKEVFTIDFNTKAVTGARTYTGSGNAFCDSFPTGEKSWSFRMQSGFPIYWEARSKARPLLLKSMQGLLGN